ncbi:MAG: hypothetical protein MUF34_00965 [Polyangiaceae bacterium]|nr:hypothetical protein [Polyangiaceae bacterium]
MPDDQELRAIDAYWRAANYLTVGQIYLQENPRLREPRRPEHIKPRLLGHGGTSPGLSLVSVHLNRLIRERGVSMLVLAGPGHGGPAVLANVFDQQPQPPWLRAEAAREHCARGASVWAWASNDEGGEPDVVLACAGDVATLETMAAAKWLRERAPGLRVRVVNVVDLMSIFAPDEHPHGMSEERFVELFARDADVVFAFHGYPGAVHQLLHGRPNAARFHVRGYREEGTTMTPFDMVVLNRTSRYHLAMEAIKRSRRPVSNAAALVAACEAELARHRAHSNEPCEDLPEIRDWWRAPSDEDHEDYEDDEDGAAPPGRR